MNSPLGPDEGDVEGLPLTNLLPVGVALHPERALHLFRQLVAMMEQAWAQDLVHGSINPANILVTPSDQLKLTGFGAKPDSQSPYRAPELTNGESPTALSDQYSLVAVLYHMLTGGPPASPDTITSPSTKRPELPGDFDGPILRGLNSDPRQRFANIAEMADRLALVSSQVASQRSPIRSLALGLAAVAAIVLAVVWFMNTQRSPDSDAALRPIEPAETIAPFAPDEARSLSCNALTQVDFEGLSEVSNLYPADGDQNRVSLLTGSGNDGSMALQIGASESYGTYGEVTTVHPGTAYVFSVSVESEGRVNDAEILVRWLDESFAVITDDEARSLPLEGSVTAQQFVMVTEPAPAGALYAVSTVAKGASDGVLIADDFVFAPAGDACATRLMP